MGAHQPRHCDRIHHETSIMYADCKTKDYHFSKVYNFSREGMYFESENPFIEGTELYVRMGDYTPASFGHEGYDLYKVRVKWCKRIPDSTSYGVGVTISGHVTE